MTTEETKRDALGRFVEGNHAGGVRQRIDALERERADLRRDLAAVEADRDTWKKQLVIFKECAAEANAAREAAERERNEFKKAAPGSVLSKVWEDLETERDNLTRVARQLVEGIESMARSCMDPTSSNWRSFLTSRAEDALEAAKALHLTPAQEEGT